MNEEKAATSTSSKGESVDPHADVKTSNAKARHFSGEEFIRERSAEVFRSRRRDKKAAFVSK
jgi:hypothetical protein